MNPKFDLNDIVRDVSNGTPFVVVGYELIDHIFHYDLVDLNGKKYTMSETSLISSRGYKTNTG